MNKEERTALLKEVLESPDVPHKVSERSIQRLVGRMKPQTQEMQDYLIAYYSAETRAQSRAFHDAFYAKLTPNQAKNFDEAYLQCIFNDLGISDEVSKEFTHETLAPSL